MLVLGFLFTIYHQIWLKKKKKLYFENSLIIFIQFRCFGLECAQHGLGFLYLSIWTGFIFLCPLDPGNPRERLTSGASDELNCNGHVPGSQAQPEEELDEVKKQMLLKQEDQHNANAGPSRDVFQGPYEYCNGLYSPEPGQSNGDMREEGEDNKLQGRPVPARDKQSTPQNGQLAAHNNYVQNI